jgi:hypothetical protein
MEQRQNPRFPVRFRSSFTSLNIVGGEGNIIDLSLRGCRVESQTEVRPGTSLEIRIETAEEEPPLNIQEAVVRWSRAQEFGWFRKSGHAFNTPSHNSTCIPIRKCQSTNLTRRPKPRTCGVGIG